MQGLPKEICWPDNRNNEKKMQSTRKLVQKEIQNKTSQIHQKEWWNHIPSPPRHRLCKHNTSREEKSYWRRLITQGLEIKKLPRTKRANMQSGYEIDPFWDDILCREPECQGWRMLLFLEIECVWKYKNESKVKKIILFSIVLIFLCIYIMLNSRWRRLSKTIKMYSKNNSKLFKLELSLTAYSFPYWQ